MAILTFRGPSFYFGLSPTKLSICELIQILQIKSVICFILGNMDPPSQIGVLGQCGGPILIYYTLNSLIWTDPTHPHLFLLGTDLTHPQYFSLGRIPPGGRSASAGGRPRAAAAAGSWRPWRPAAGSRRPVPAAAGGWPAAGGLAGGRPAARMGNPICL